MTAKKHIYDSVLNFTLNLKETRGNIFKYLQFIAFKDTLESAFNSIYDKKSSIQYYNAIIMFNSFLFRRIEIICSICNNNVLRYLPENEII